MKKGTTIGRSKWDLDTPCLALDYDLFTQNLAFMRNHVAAHGKLVYKGSPKIKRGDIFERVVSHCDPTVNLVDEIYVTSADRIIDVGQVDLRGKSQ